MTVDRCNPISTSRSQLASDSKSIQAPASTMQVNTAHLDKSAHCALRPASTEASLSFPQVSRDPRVFRWRCKSMCADVPRSLIFSAGEEHTQSKTGPIRPSAARGFFETFLAVACLVLSYNPHTTHALGIFHCWAFRTPKSDLQQVSRASLNPKATL